MSNAHEQTARAITHDAVRACKCDEDRFVMSCPHEIEKRVTTALEDAAKAERKALERIVNEVEKYTALLLQSRCFEPPWRIVETLAAIAGAALRAEGKTDG